MTNLNVSNAFILEPNQREGRLSCGVITKPELAFLVLSPNPNHAVLINSCNVRLTDRARLHTDWNAANSERGRVLPKLPAAPDIQGALTSGQGERVGAASNSLNIIQILNFDWFVDVIAVRVRNGQLTPRVVSSRKDAAILSQE